MEQYFKEFEVLCRKKISQRIQAILIPGAITLWSATTTGFSLTSIASGLYEIYRFIVYEMFSVNPEILMQLVEPSLSTIIMSYVAVMASIAVAFVLAFFASASTSPHPWLQIVTRGFATGLRTIPDMVWVMLVVPAYGIGVTAGTIALFISGTGLLTRSFAEVLEAIDTDKLNALKAAGANWIQIMGRGVMPQFLPGLASWSLFGFDTNIRSSAIIGMVGGGGLGFAIQSGLKLYRFDVVTMAILEMAVLFIVIDYITDRIRRCII